MGKEKIAPNNRSVPSSGGVKEGNAHLTTPKQETSGKAPWGGKEAKNRIM